MKKNEEPQRNMEHHYAHQHIRSRSTRKRGVGERREKKIFEEIMAKNFPEFIEKQSTHLGSSMDSK